MHHFFDRFFHRFFFHLGSIFLQKSTKILPKIDSKMHHIFDRFSHRFFFDLGSILEANLEPCWPPWGHLGGSWRPLGGLLGRLGGLLGPLRGQDPPEPRGGTFLEASWGRLGFISGRFLDGFFNDFSTLFLSYPSSHQHVVKPQNYYTCSTEEPFKALRGQYFSSTFKYFKGL